MCPFSLTHAMNSDDEIKQTTASGADLATTELEQMLHAATLLPTIPGQRIARVGAQTPNNLELASNPCSPPPLYIRHSTPPLYTAALDDFVRPSDLFPTRTFEAAMEVQVHPMYRHRTPREPILVQTPLWITISPHRNIPLSPQTYITNFVEDHLVRSIEVNVVDHIMPWGTRGFELMTSFSGELQGGEVLHCSGDVKGRWVVDDKMFAMEDYDCTLVRIFNRQCLMKAAIAVRCDQVALGGTPQYEEQLKAAFLAHARRELDGSSD
ncbi:hypothetical protein C8R47DRAFT_1084603 [Mycena vitilis]|nr:hypothetical protein C8R47DRAFT_1085198 [Mycena vitilis]KAJ6449912.1 hypothetical protein C8R47DRAFT_1084603 [Mycena vitilis]